MNGDIRANRSIRQCGLDAAILCDVPNWSKEPEAALDPISAFRTCSGPQTAHSGHSQPGVGWLISGLDAVVRCAVHQ